MQNRKTGDQDRWWGDIQLIRAHGPIGFPRSDTPIAPSRWFVILHVAVVQSNPLRIPEGWCDLQFWIWWGAKPKEEPKGEATSYKTLSLDLFCSSSSSNTFLFLLRRWFKLMLWRSSSVVAETTEQQDNDIFWGAGKQSGILNRLGGVTTSVEQECRNVLHWAERWDEDIVPGVWCQSDNVFTCP